MKKIWITIAFASATLMTSCGLVKSPEQKAIEATKRRIKEYDDAANKRIKRAEELMFIVSDENRTSYERSKALDELTKLYPELLEKYGREGLRIKLGWY